MVEVKHRIGIIVLAASLVLGFAALGAYFHELSGAGSYDVTGWRGAASQQSQVSAAAGGALFNGRGSCMACHTIGDQGVGIRGPNLGVRAPDFPESLMERSAASQEGKTAVEHLVESFYDPNAFVRPGFEAGIMIPVNGPPTMLNDEEIRSILLYLFQQNGVPITTELEEEIATAQQAYSTSERADDSPEPEAGLTGDAERGRARFGALGCDGCHREGSEGEAQRPAPELGSGHTQMDLLMRIARHPIGDPPEEATYGASLTVQDTADLVAFLLAAPVEASTDAAEPR